MTASDEPTADERETLALVARLRADGDITTLLGVLHHGRAGHERARDALAVLAELDPELIVQVALDVLIQAHADDASAAAQTRRVLRKAPQ